MTETEARDLAKKFAIAYGFADAKYEPGIWIVHAIQAGATAEREACARVCRELADGCRKIKGPTSAEMMQAYEYAAADILARSNA